MKFNLPFILISTILLVWHFCLCKSPNEIKQIQKLCLIISNVNQSDYETILGKSSKTTMNIKKGERDLATEIFKTINKLNPPSLKKMFKII